MVGCESNWHKHPSSLELVQFLSYIPQKLLFLCKTPTIFRLALEERVRRKAMNQRPISCQLSQVTRKVNHQVMIVSIKNILLYHFKIHCTLNTIRFNLQFSH